ncbi:OSM3-like kinesin, putative [Trypanosoma cruzi marinkellei]|uniref:OSM3-like kinesin, putative n=1 Tax=Trypanosoma cruzi marinkellei TaxID=85056 RepID=K2MW61_TRYCR|nr:OSM3-like kinesin, putative [Trypanosoma cruzi marinkellei]
MLTDPVNRLEELQAEVLSRQNALSSRIQSILSETGDKELPELQVLSDDRVQLIKEIQHTKDEGDALLLQVEGNAEAASMYRVAARVQRFEEFANRANEYVKNVLPEEIERVADADRHHSDDEVAAYIKELQAKREEELRKIGLLKERTTKRANDLRNGPRVENGELNALCRVSRAKEEEPDKETRETQEYVDEARLKKVDLIAKIKELRQAKSKLQVELLDTKHKNEKKVNEMKARIRHAELANKRDIRVCQQLNTTNAALTTNAQTLLGQLNVEHYGIEGAPSEKALITMRKEEERRAAAALANGRGNNNNNGSHPAGNEPEGLCPRGDTGNFNGDASAESSRRHSNQQNPALAELQQTASQRSRDASQKADLYQRRQSGQSSQASRHSEASKEN